MSDYQRRCYEGNPSYRLYRITGTKTEKSNFSYLHYDSELTVSYFRKGGGFVKIEGRSYEINEGDIVLLNPRELHCFSFDGSVFHDRVVIYIKESVLQSLSCSCEGFFDVFYKKPVGIGNRICADVAEKFGLHTILEDILSFTESDDSMSDVLAVCRVVELVAQLNRAVLPQIPQEMPADAENPLINDVLKYINQGFLTIPDIEAVADAFFVNKYYLSRMFTRCVGISLWDYVILRRLLFCNDLIRENVTIEQACLSAGFKNYSNFFRLYKKHFGMSPQEFKRRLLQN